MLNELRFKSNTVVYWIQQNRLKPTGRQSKDIN